MRRINNVKCYQNNIAIISSNYNNDVNNCVNVLFKRNDILGNVMIKALTRLWKNLFDSYQPEARYMKGPLEEMKKDPNKRIDGKDMSDTQKMDAGFSNGTYNINGRDVDF